MNGARAGTLVKIIRTANSNKIAINGINQNFFLVFKKRYNSFKNSIEKLVSCQNVCIKSASSNK